MKALTQTIASTLFVLTTLPCNDAWAQDGAAPGRFRAGPFYLSPTVTLRDIGIDTNVYNENTPDPTKDFVFTFVPAVTATVRSPRVGLDLTSATDLVYFAHERSERSVNENFTAAARFPLGRIIPIAEAGYLNTRERVSAEIDLRARRIERRGLVGADLLVTPKFATLVRADLARIEYDEDGDLADRSLARELNRDESKVSLGVRYALTPLTSVSVTTELSQIRFMEALIRDADSRQAIVGIDLRPRALISGSARVGYQSLELLSAVLPDFSGLVGSGELLYRFQGATSLGFSYDRNVSYSYLPLQPYYVRQGFGLLVRRQIVRQWQATLSGERYRHEYRQSSAPAEETDGYAERILGGALVLDYDLGPRTRFTVGLSYQTRRAELENRSYDGFRVGSSIVYAF